jgi:undecaprenyl-diphosphatase
VRSGEKPLEQLIKAVLLGVIQGLTEWLPISSTGHLRLFEKMLGFEVPVVFDVILHVGTLIVVLTFFRKEIWKMLTALVRLNLRTEHGRMIPSIIIGTVPTALIGVIFGRQIEERFQGAVPIAIAFVICGLMLYSAKTGKERTEKIDYSTAVIIGVAQGVAIIPGISRSGATIAAALLLGIKREQAFRFSFLLSIPTLFGALGFTVYTEFGELTASGLGLAEVLMGTVAAMLVGYFALKLLWKILLERKFHLFALYCWLLGVALIALVLSGFQPFGLA